MKRTRPQVERVVIAEAVNESVVYGTFKTLKEARERFIISNHDDYFLTSGNTLFVYLVD